MDSSDCFAIVFPHPGSMPTDLHCCTAYPLTRVQAQLANLGVVTPQHLMWVPLRPTMGRIPHPFAKMKVALANPTRDLFIVGTVGILPLSRARSGALLGLSTADPATAVTRPWPTRLSTGWLSAQRCQGVSAFTALHRTNLCHVPWFCRNLHLPRNCCVMERRTLHSRTHRLFFLLDERDMRVNHKRWLQGFSGWNAWAWRVRRVRVRLIGNNLW